MVTINGTTGNDFIDKSGETDKFKMYGDDGNDTLIGGTNDDELFGENGDDSLVGNEGKDKLEGGDGNDTLVGGDGKDDLKGGGGDNVLDGGAGDDKIKAEDGNDTIDGGDGKDDIDAKGGDNLIDAGAGDDKVKSDDGNDTIHGGLGDDDIDAKDGDNVVDGGEGDDKIKTGDGDDTVDGGAGDDKIETKDGNDSVLGGAGEDDIKAGKGDDFVDGGNDDDKIKGEDGNDTLFGGGGADDIDSGKGDDVVGGGEGDDELDGKDGFDTAVFEGSVLDYAIAQTGGDEFTVTDLNTADGDEGTDELKHFEALQFGDYTLAINGDNNAPLIVSGLRVADEDNILGFALTAFEFDGDAVTLDNISVTGDGTISSSGGTPVGTNGTSFDIAFDPGSAYQYLAVGESVTETVTVTVSDDQGGTSVETFDLVVNGVNDDPVALAGTATGDEDSQITGVLTATDVDTSDELTFAVLTQATNGTVAIDDDGNYTYAPNQDFNGTDTFTYQVDDGNGGTDTATVGVTVNAVNDAPVAVDDAATTDEDTAVTIDVRANDSDVDNLTGDLSVDSASAGNGSVVVNGDGTVTYTPDGDFNGTDTITYTISDPDGLTSTASVTVTVNAVNDAPVAVDDTALTPVETAVDINVLGNDSDVENDPLTVVSFAQPESGTVAETAPGVFTYTPDAGFTGTDAFTYTIDDGVDGTSTATVVVNVGAPPVNTAPNALNTTVEATIEDGETNVLTIDFNSLTVEGQPIVSDADQSIAQLDITSLTIRNGERLGVEFVETSPGSNVFTLDLDALNVEDGAFRNLVVDYTVDDGQASDNTAMGVITLEIENPDDTPVNIPPEAADQTINQAEDDGLIIINLTAENGLATDQNGDPLTVTSLVFTDEFGNELEIDPLEFDGTGESGGIVTIDPTVFGVEESGTFLLTYTVSDGTDSATGVVTLNITESETNSPPTTIPGTETRTLPDDLILSSNNIEFDLQFLVDDDDLDPLSISLVSITDALGNTIPIVDPLNDLIGGDGVVTGTIFDGVVTINVIELELEDGETIDFVINYTVSDGVNPPVAGTLDVTVIAPEPLPTGSVVEDFESFSSHTGASIELTNLAGLNFDGTATVIEVDEAGERAAPGLIVGETTVEQSETVPDGNAAVIGGELIGFDGTTGLPEYGFTAYAPGATLDLNAGPINIGSSPLESFFGSAFDLEGMSMAALSGGDTIVTIIPYRVELNAFNEYVYVAVGEFEVTVNSTTATSLDFTSGAFFDALIFDDPETIGVTETSALENIVAVQFVTTGELASANQEDPTNAETVPAFDDPLVFDDLVFDFG